jgi:hypothetical protein
VGTIPSRRDRVWKHGVWLAIGALACGLAAVGFVPASALSGAASANNGGSASQAMAPYSKALPPLAEGYSCKGAVRDGDVWLTVGKSGSPSFDLRIGAAGDIAEFRDRRNSKHTMLMEPAYPGNVTDRVIQETYWSFATTNPANGNFLNVNQAGDDLNNLNPTGFVTIHNPSCSIDVYSIPQLDWNSDEYWQNYLPTVTHYQVFSTGVVLVRRVTNVYAQIMTGGLRYGMPTTGAQSKLTDLTLSAWVPLDPQFTVAAQHFDGQKPDWYYLPSNISSLYKSVSKTFGYTMLYNPDTEPQGSAGLGLIYGTKLPKCAAAGKTPTKCSTSKTSYAITAMAGETEGAASNFILAPNLIIEREVSMGTVVARDLYLYPTHGLSQTKIDRLDTLSQGMPAPTVYAPGAKLPPDLAPYAGYFKAPYADAYTDHLGGITTFQ